jgi:hypothetical protein
MEIGLLILSSLFVLLMFVKYRKDRHSYLKQVGYSKRGQGYIYFYKGKWELPLFIKIGRSNNVYKRMLSARTANPFGIILYGVIRVRNDIAAEAEIHRMFWRLSSKNEWFIVTPKLIWFITCVRDARLTRKIQDEL